MLGHKNPDFVNKESKIIIEVYHKYFKIRDFGSCEEYEKQKRAYFEEYGYKTIFIRTEEITAKNWEEVCIDKITEGAACTVLLAKNLINDDTPLLMANSDQFLEWDSNEFLYCMNS